MKDIIFRKKKTVIAIIIVILIFGIYYFFSNGEEKKVFSEVVYGDITKEIFESGVLKKGEEINLGFKTGGIVGDIYVKIGERVKEGDILGKLDNIELKFQFEKSLENLEIAKSNLKKMENGYTKEEIDSYKTTVSNTEKSFSNIEKSLEDSKKALISQLKDAYIKSDDAIGSKIDKFFENPKSSNANFEVSIIDGGNTYFFPVLEKDRLEINDKKIETENNLEKISNYLIREDPSLYVLEITNSIREIIVFLDKVATVMNSFSTYDVSYESFLYQYKTDVSSARSSLNLALSGIYSSLNSYNATISSYDVIKGNLDSAKSQLEIILKGIRKEDINIQKSLINQIETDIKIIERQIEDSSIKALKDGIVTDIRKKKGEIIQPGEVLFSFLSDNSYLVEVNIYEGEIARVSVKDRATIELVAFPYEKFKGEIVSIEPVGRVIDGVVYYKSILYIEDLTEKAMSGMTADIIITTVEKENVLVIEENSITRIEGKVFVDVLEGKEIKERQIEVGSRGDGRIIEVISGLEEGEKVLVK